ncbi:ABC transporter substrate-binding protein [Anaerosporobacter sp.]|uniref:ABC transporter substrate-binding protein n=1 Tax=Anaerosporobacter sp. TaxID=1872529 RepID=UPI00286F6F15|nr:ABC transporter substrate-binding protein [Anaerosporobacter sp.]
MKNIKNLWKYILSGLYLIVIAFVLTSCGRNASSKEVTSDSNAQEVNEEGELKKLRLALTTESNELSGILLIAQQQNYLKEELEAVGYELEVFGFAQAGPAINEAFAGKSIDMAIYGNLPPIVLKSNGVDVSIIAMTDSNLDQCIIVPENSTIQTVEDLKGKTVISGKGTVLDEYFRRVLQANDLDFKDINVVNDVATASATFTSGNADALVTTTIQALLIEKQFPIRVIESTTDSHKELISQLVLVARNEYLQENEEVTTAFLKAYIRGYQYAVSHEEEAIDAFVNDRISHDIAKEVYGNKTEAFSNLSGEITEKWIERLQEVEIFLKENGLIGESVDMKELVNDSYYKEALLEVTK